MHGDSPSPPLSQNVGPTSSKTRKSGWTNVPPLSRASSIAQTARLSPRLSCFRLALLLLISPHTHSTPRRSLRRVSTCSQLPPHAHLRARLSRINDKYMHVRMHTHTHVRAHVRAQCTGRAHQLGWVRGRQRALDQSCDHADAQQSRRTAVFAPLSPSPFSLCLPLLPPLPPSVFLSFSLRSSVNP